MYRVSSSVRSFARALLAGVTVATVWVNLSPARYYDAIEYRLADLALPAWAAAAPVSLTPMALVAHGLMALFLAYLAKELWEALVLERGPFRGRARAALPAGAVIGAMAGAALTWLVTAALIETAAEAGFGTGWAVPLGSDAVLGYVIGRWVFGAGHPALHLLLLIAIAQDIAGLIVLGLAFPVHPLAPVWLALPILASGGVWLLVGRRVHPGASERDRQTGLALWPYVLAGLVGWTGVALAGLPPALGLLPVIPAIPHAERAFGLFAEAEGLLHDPLNRLAQHLVRVLPVVLFAFGLTRGGIDFGALAPTTGTVLAALWIGKPLGLLAGAMAAMALTRSALPAGVTLRDLVLIAVILGAGFTIPTLAIETALPGGGMSEAARAGLALSLGAAPVAFLLSRLLRH